MPAARDDAARHIRAEAKNAPDHFKTKREPDQQRNGGYEISGSQAISFVSSVASAGARSTAAAQTKNTHLQRETFDRTIG